MNNNEKNEGLSNARKTTSDELAYNVGDMSYLNDLEHVRARAGTYIGDLGEHGLHHLVHEVIDNSLDEAMAGHATQIRVTVFQDGSISIADDGRGIPVEFDERVGKSALECVMTLLKYGGKFEDSAYKASGGLNGMGLKTVNFLSESCRVTVHRDGLAYQQVYSRGVPVDSVQEVGESSSSGTEIHFLPDAEMFGDQQFQKSILYQRLQNAAFINQNVQVEFVDQRDESRSCFHYKQGLVEWVQHHQEGLRPLHQEVIAVEGNVHEVEVRVAFRYHLDAEEYVRCYANNVFNENGGTHLTGFRAALTRSLMQFAKRENLLGPMPVLAQDLREGLTAIVSVRLSQPQFDAQHKVKLTSQVAEKSVQQVVGEFLKSFWEENPSIAKSIVAKACVAAQARLQAKEVRKRLLSKSRTLGGMPGKLRDCLSKDPKTNELYLVEGDSAGGSAEGGRIREFQAILPLRGKIINAFKNSTDKVLSNQEVQSVIQSLGIGVGQDLAIERLRYHKVIIMTDADVDGSHIRTLLLCFFYRQMPQLILDGHVLIAQPPLFRIKSRGKNFYIQSDEALEQVLLERGLKSSRLVLSSGDEIGGPRLAEFVSSPDPFPTFQKPDSNTNFDGSTLVSAFKGVHYSKPLHLKVHNEEVLVSSLNDLRAELRKAGEQGVQVTRFKGLGEMNAEELRQTTLHPDKRSLVRVTMRDAQKAHDMFQLLMGVVVEPRRKFIESNALNVKSIDV